MSLLLTGIAELVTNDGAAGDRAFAAIPDAALVIEAGRLAWTGPASRAPVRLAVSTISPVDWSRIRESYALRRIRILSENIAIG